MRIKHNVSKIFIATRGDIEEGGTDTVKVISIMHFLQLPWLSHSILLSTDFALMLHLFTYFSVMVPTAQLVLASGEGLPSVWMSGKLRALARAQKSLLCLMLETLSAMTAPALSPLSYSFPTCNREKQKRNASKRSQVWSPVGKFVESWNIILRKSALHFWLRTKICLLPESPAEQHLGGRHLEGIGCIPSQLTWETVPQPAHKVPSPSEGTCCF